MLAELRPLNDAQFSFFRDIVYREAGIKLSENKRALVQSRLMRRMRNLRLESYTAYAEYLVENYHNEIVEFINAITTNKTEFFREKKHFEFLLNNVFPDYVSQDKDHIRVWSAGCSTGEEPYTLAMTFSEYYGKNMPDVKILATDIDTQVLDYGKRGIYRDETIQNLDISLVRRYFLKGQGDNNGLYRVKPDLRKMVVFNRLNLLQESYPMKNRLDIIFCRNVVIYFDRDTQRELFERFYNYLDDDGYLFVGHSENLGAVTKKFKHLGGTIYRKIL